MVIWWGQWEVKHRGWCLCQVVMTSKPWWAGLQYCFILSFFSLSCIRMAGWVVLDKTGQVWWRFPNREPRIPFFEVFVGCFGFFFRSLFSACCIILLSTRSSSLLGRGIVFLWLDACFTLVYVWGVVRLAGVIVCLFSLYLPWLLGLIWGVYT